MKEKTRKGLIIAGSIVGAIFVLLMMNELGAIEIGRSNLWFGTYKGKPTYQFVEDQKQKKWKDIDIDGEIYTYDPPTVWRAKEAGKVIGYAEYERGFFKIQEVQDDENRDFLKLDAKWGKAPWNILYYRSTMEVPQVDIQTVDELRFYRGQDMYSDYLYKSQLELLGATRDKTTIARILDGMENTDSNRLASRSIDEYLGILQFLSDKYIMLEYSMPVFKTSDGEYVVSEGYADEGPELIYDPVYISPEAIEPLLGRQE